MDTTKRLIENFIQALKKTTITLEELEALFSDVCIDWIEFATVLLLLEEDKTLEAVKSSGRTTKSPKIAYRYRVNKHLISSTSRSLLNQDQLAYHPSIKLDGYHSVPVQEYEQDKQWITRIDEYIKQYGFPQEAVPAPEQYPVNHCEHQFFYFGDLDYEGIRIWYETNKQRPIRPASIFYEALLDMPFVIGKHNQRRNEASVQALE